MDYELLFQRLKDLREDNDLTQEEMAKILDVSQSNYARWEVKIKIIPLNKLNDFCNHFNINMDYVIGLTNNKEHIDSCCLDKKIIAERLKDFRKKNNVTQVQLAKQLGTDHSVIYAYEKEKTLILTVFLVDICIRYNISADWICDRKK